MLPAFSTVLGFLSVLPSIERAALASGLQALVLAGATPPVDETLELTTITPDPAVIEVNMAPSRNCGEFLWRSQQVYAAALALKLSPYRLYFNGQVADSGGAGQITYGGPTPQTSPFIQYGQLLPGLVRFLNRHPALSYLFAHDFVGGSGQSVRPDERGLDAFDDLVLALALMDRQQDMVPELLWKSLASFLCDGVGNSHRAEINIEKLWNPYLPGRGRLGLVEFRSLRMQHTAQRATAIACLFRALMALHATRPCTLPLIDWGRDLHDRFALPFYLKADLDSVLAELEAAGVGLRKEICQVLHQNEYRFFGKVDLPFGTLELWRGLEFWPLVGDASSPQQTGSSRTVDASTTRIEVRWMPPTVEMEGSAPLGSWHDWGIYVNEIRLPLNHEQDSHGALAVFGIRYSSFVPGNGLHPTLVDQTPITLMLRHPHMEEQYVVKLHEWHPDGLAYPGLPRDLEDARERRSARVTVAKENRPFGSRPQPDAEARPLNPGLTHYSLDLRFSSLF
ncbi:MAG: transglutaminase family protein [Rhodoferax sp.]|nr:transglutaminase family protein [Rhodoferax sp.]